MTDEATRRILDALAPYKNTDHGSNRYNAPWRPNADGGTLAVDTDAAYGLGLKWYDHKDGDAGNGWTLAERLGIAIAGRTPDDDTPYASLADYAHAHGCPVDVFQAAGWKETTKRDHLVFAFKTKTGTRYRYADPKAAGRKYDSDKGYTNCWYGLQRAADLAATGAPFVICNGEASTVAALHHGVAACCVTGGEKGTITAALLNDLKAAWNGPILVAFDCDVTGRKAGVSLATFLQDAGLNARAVNLQGANGFDIADYCRLHNGTSAQQLAALPTLADHRAEIVRLTPDELAQVKPTSATTFPTPITAAELAQKQIEPTRYFIPEMLRTGLALFIGNPGIGKTPAVIQLALALAMGGKWLGAIQCPACRVLYIGVEYDEAYIKEVAIDSYGSSDLPDTLLFLSVETFTPPSTEQESIAMLAYYLTVFKVDVVVIDVFSGFLPREKFKQDKYRGDYAEFLAYQKLFMNHKALLVGSWHGNKRDKDPETAYNGGQGMWGSAGGGRLTMSFDDENQVRLRSQLRGHERKEWVLEQARVGNAHFWSVVDADPDPIFGSDAQRRIYMAVKRHSTPAEPITPAGIKALLQADAPELGLREAYIRQTLMRLTERGILSRWGGGYIVDRTKTRGSGGSDGSDGTRGSGGSVGSGSDRTASEWREGDPSDPSPIHEAIQPVSHQDAKNKGRSKRSTNFSDPQDSEELFTDTEDERTVPFYVQFNQEQDWWEIVKIDGEIISAHETQAAAESQFFKCCEAYFGKDGA